MATPPFVPGAQTNDVLGSAGGDAQKMAIQIIQQATQGPQNPIQNRPQVILPQPRVPAKLPTDTPPTGQVQATTRAGQRRNDMQSLISSVGNIVKAGINKKNQNVERDVMHDLAIIQAASSNPDDPQNKAILDKMMQDPKVVKRLQKALGYNPLAGEPPPTEAKAMMKFQASQQPRQQAIQAASQRSAIQNNPALTGGGGGDPGFYRNNPSPNTDPGFTKPNPSPNTDPGFTRNAPQPGMAMNNLLSRMPNTQQINPVVSMQAELIKAGILPKNDLGPKAILDYVTELMKDDTKREELKARAQATNNVAMMRLYDTIVRADAMLKRGAASDTSKEKVGAGHDAAYRYGADQRFAAAEKHAIASDPTFRNLKIASDAYDKDIQRTEEQLSTLLKQKSTGTQEKGVNIDEAIVLKKQELDKFKSLKNTMTDMMRDRLKVETPSGGVDNLLQEDTPKEEDMQFGDYVFGEQKQ